MITPSTILQENDVDILSTESSLDVDISQSSLPTPGDLLENLSSPSNNLRRSKRNRVKNRNVYGGKGVHSCHISDLRNDAFLQSLDWNDLHKELLSSDHMSFMNVINKEADPFTGDYEELHPMLLASKLNASDNPNYHQAVNGPDADGYLEAMDLEYNTLHDKMNAWSIIPRTKDMHVLASTWAFKCKRFPNGLVRKLKARFCVRGDLQIEGVDFFDTYAPVIQWTTICLLLILSIHLNLSSMQVTATKCMP